MSTDPLSSNIDSIKEAAFLTLGSFANEKLAILARNATPLRLKSYVDSSIGKLVLANITNSIANTVAPTNKLLTIIT